MESPFKLTKCKKLSQRRRTLGGITSYYYTYFEPLGLNHHDRRVAIDSFKHSKTKEDRKISDKMVQYSIDEFLKIHNVNDFDVIMGLPSSSGIVKKIVGEFIHRGFKGTVIYKGFKKTRIRNVKFKQHVVDRESSLKTKEKVYPAFLRTRKLHYDKVSKASLFPTRFRRYIENILELGWKAVGNLGTGPIKNQKILVVDDTFGEGLTMCEVFRILKPYTTNVVGFTVMKDMARKIKNEY